MTQLEHTHPRKSKEPAASWIPADFVQVYGKPPDALIEMQKQFLDSFDEANRAWLQRLRLSAMFGIEFFSKIAAARSVAAAAAAYGECINRQLDMLAEDNRRIFDDCKKLVKSGTRLFSNGRSGHAT